jgi:flagellar motor component MotA
LDKASIFGVVTGVALVLMAILLGGALGTFVNVQGVLIVAGGTFAATSIAFPTHELKLIFPVSRRVFNDPGDEMLEISKFLVQATGTLKREGPVALEKVAGQAPSKPPRSWPPNGSTWRSTTESARRSSRRWARPHPRSGWSAR